MQNYCSVIHPHYDKFAVNANLAKIIDKTVVINSSFYLVAMYEVYFMILTLITQLYQFCTVTFTC